MDEKMAEEAPAAAGGSALPGSVLANSSVDMAPTSSSNSSTDVEELREEVRRHNPNGASRVGSGMSVEQAEADYDELRRELSRASRVKSRTSQHNVGKSGADLEARASSENERFDLERYIRGGLAAEREAGIPPKQIGVYWDGLTVKGMGGMSNFVRTFPDVLVGFFDIITPLLGLLGRKPKGTEATLLDNFRGVCKPGEMVLVLGKPGSGCTTFLKTITNQRYGYTGVEGEVRYGPFTADEFRRYRGEAVYNQEDDVHHATLTVEQTLGFALDTKIPGTLPAGLTRSQFKEDVITMLLKMFNIEHTRHTVVGGALVRGISGGERKRVSVAEMMVTSACILSWDNSTRGLDASTALDFIKSLRIQTNLYRTATFVSLYQASENIYSLFDKVLVIDGGRQVYFGPATAARAYFEGLGFLPRPRQTTPDYVTGCTDEFERDYAPGFSPENAPHDPASLAEAFRRSRFAREMEEEMKTYKAALDDEAEAQRHRDFRSAVAQAKRTGAKRSVYSVGFPQQVWALMKRQTVLKLQDRTALTLSWIRSIIIAVVVGTLYLNLPQTTSSAFGKGGLMFISLLFNAFEAFAELGSTMTGRGIVNKHKAYAFHRPSALWIGQIFVDQAFTMPRILVFSLLVYFMTNLARSAGAFFMFYLFILTGNIAMTLFFRIIGCLSPDFDYAVKFAVTTITLLIVTSGYLIQYQSEPVWLRWIYWINPLGLMFSSMMTNEFGRIVMTCTAESLIPSGPEYGDIGNQVCTLPGSEPGTLDVSGSAYMRQGFSYDPADVWRNWGIVAAIIVFFLILNVVFGELVSFGAGGNTFRVYQKPNAERDALNKELQSKRAEKRAAPREKAAAPPDDEAGAPGTSTPSSGRELEVKSERVLTWEKLNYDVPVPGGTRRLLNNVFGYVKPGQLTALMGSSGAGKTTLLDVLAARKNIGVISGDILVDGTKPGKQFQRSTSYAEQIDMHDPTQTVREALRFSADLRQAFETPQAEKYAYVEEILALLELEDLADCVIGTPEAGLTVEQRKRVTIGVELAAKPELLLFLDEPTSGLDSQSAFNIVRFLKKLAGAGQAILCTVHQPNSALFENFDRLLLLKSGGRCVYFGDIGQDASVLRDYLRRHGAVAKDTDNVAEFMLEAIGAGSAPRIGNRDWADIWEDSPEMAATKETIMELKRERIQAVAATTSGAAAAGKEATAEREYASPFTHQLRVVMQRTNLSYWRSPNYLFTRLFNHVIIALITGLVFLRLDESRSSLQYKVFVMFQITVLPALVISQVELKYHIQRAIYFREASSKMYNTFAFATSMLVAEMPYSVLCAVGFFLPLYYMPGFQTESSRAGLLFFIILITEVFSVTMGQALSALTPSTFISSQFDPFLMITFAMFCGVAIPAPQMPAGWRWLHQLDPFTRLIGATVTTTLHELPVRCHSSELNAFAAPQGTACGEYMEPFFGRGGIGYIVDNVTSACQYCAYSAGDQFYEPLGFRFDNRWRDTGIFLAFVGSNIIILYLGSRFLNFNRR